MIIDTASGPLRGLRFGGVRAWLGIPYAAPPVGRLRFRPPQPAEPWAEPRQALVFGAAAPQISPAQQREMPSTPLAAELLSLLYPFSGSPVGGVPIDEDCLVLNVWSPDEAAGARPVMVWFHGGAFLHGAGSEPGFWGDRLVDRHDVVVVTVNHRLGALGYLPIGVDGAGQAGMLDLVAALEWVRDNIAAFGGDPDNVTIFGQSGGGMKVSTLMAMPAASGLFHKAIVMSGPGLHLPRHEDAAPIARALFAVLGIDDGDVDALRELPAESIVGAQFAAMAAAPAVHGGWGPVVDGHHIVGDPLSSEQTSAPLIPLLTGCTTEEAGMFLAMDPTYPTVNASGLADRLAYEFGTDAPQILAAYGNAFPAADPPALLRRVISDRDIRVSAIQFADRKLATSQAPVFTYLFDYDSGVLDGLVGATHSGELAFVFDNADRIPLSGTRPDRDALADHMASSWVAFAETGNPSTGHLEWPPYSAERNSTMIFDGARPHAADDPDRDCRLLVSGHPSRLFPRI